ncbi:MAG TPA: efflux RND transporter permease subunit, partial [Bacteroidales bacterium]|nr:efflux RND transporter permease subunit [Bacteroidales bacterium]
MDRFYTTFKNPVSVAIAIVIMGGMFAYSKLQTSLFPEITFPKIKVIADDGELPIDQMMLTVTRPIELAIKQVPDLATIRSTTDRGSCEISAFMNWNSDIDISQQRIESKINEIRNTLPPEVQITVERMNPSILPVIGYKLKGRNYSPIELKYLATYTIKPFLSQVDGVSEIRIIGGKEKEYWVLIDQARMSTLRITPEKIRSALSGTDFIRSNGYLSDYRLLYLTLTDARIKNKDDIGRIVISNDRKRIITLNDIASVEIKEAKEYVKINADGSDAVLVAVIKQPNANLIDLSDRMSAKLKELRPVLPAGVELQPYYVQADFVRDTIRSVNDSLWIGLLLAIFVAILFLHSLKASTTILLTIPLTLFLTLIVLHATGQTLNIMTLGAMAA